MSNSKLPANDSQLVNQSKPILNSEDRQHALSDQLDCGWVEPFFFVQAADTQFGLIDNYLRKVQPVTWVEEMRLSEQLVAACNRMQPKPRFLVVCGDLVDAWPGTQLKRDQVFDFKRIFAKLDAEIPLVCVCGNHDIGNEPTESSLAEYKRDFGDDYFYFISGGVLFIVINSQFYQNRSNLLDYARKQDVWLETMLTRCKEFKYSIVFEHIPWFLRHFDEPDECYEGDLSFNIHRETRLVWLRKFHEAGVDKILCGHYHQNAGGFYHELEVVVTSAVGGQFGSDQSGARLVRLLDESIEHQYYALGELPERVAL